MFLTYHFPGRENSFARINCSAAINSGLEDLICLSVKVTINDVIDLHISSLPDHCKQGLTTGTSVIFKAVLDCIFVM